MCNRDYKSGDFGEMALITVLRVKELELDHLAAIAKRGEEEKILLVWVFCLNNDAHINPQVLPQTGHSSSSSPVEIHHYAMILTS